jgi:hypothetical protein
LFSDPGYIHNIYLKYFQELPMDKSEYNGSYRIGARPDTVRLEEHNAKTWMKLEKCLAAAGGAADFEALSTAATGHESGSENAPHPYQFVIYCIKNGWLERIPRATGSGL